MSPRHVQLTLQTRSRTVSARVLQLWNFFYVRVPLLPKRMSKWKCAEKQVPVGV